MEKNNFKISKYDTEVAAKWKDLLETAKEKGVLEIEEPCLKKQIVAAILIDCYTLCILILVSIAMGQYFGLAAIAILPLFCYTHNISYDPKNYFHKLIENWRKTE